jgi:hypothetical protein
MEAGWGRHYGLNEAGVLKTIPEDFDVCFWIPADNTGNFLNTFK